MTTCPNPSPVRCKVDHEAIRQSVLAHMAMFSWVPDRLPEVISACRALRPAGLT